MGTTAPSAPSTGERAVGAAVRGRFTPRSVDFDAFHTRLTSSPHSGLAGRAAEGLAPLVLNVPGGGAYSYVPADGTVRIVPGRAADAGCVVELPRRVFSDFANELLTAAGVQAIGRARYDVGSYVDLDGWEPAVRALYHGRPLYDPHAVRREDLGTVFPPDGDDRELAAFLHRNGFAVVRDVFDTGETARMLEEVARLTAEAADDRRDSWWTFGPDGTELPCQLHYTGLASDTIASLETDPRVLRLADLAGPGLRPGGASGLGHLVVLKRPGAESGLVNLPWHTDCGVGGHPVLCPAVYIGVQLTASNPATGAFQVLAGSHGASVRREHLGTDGTPVVTMDTRPGDVTLHVTDVLHAAPPPLGTDEGRRTLYLRLCSASADAFLGYRRAFDDLVSAAGAQYDGHVGFDPSPAEGR